MPGANRYMIMTATGKQLAEHMSLEEAVRQGGRAWDALPDEERRPRFPVGLPKVANMSSPPNPPKNGLILRSQSRGLQRHRTTGELVMIDRLVVGDGSYTFENEPQPDHVWLTEEEWKTLIPADPKVGQDVPLSKAIATRIAVFHLFDRGLGCMGFCWDKATGQMTATVSDVTDARISVRLTGLAKVGKAGDMPVRLQGIVEIDRARSEITRFDLLALGKTDGDARPEDLRVKRFEFSYQTRPNHGLVMAISFEKINGDKDIDRVPPLAVMVDSGKTYNKPYFAK